MHSGRGQGPQSNTDSSLPTSVDSLTVANCAFFAQWGKTVNGRELFFELKAGLTTSARADSWLIAMRLAPEIAPQKSK